MYINKEIILNLFFTETVDFSTKKICPLKILTLLF